MAELRREVVELRRQARYYRRMHGKAVAREQRLKNELQAARAKLKELRQRLRERWARRRESEQRTRSAGGTEAAVAAPARQRGQQPGAAGHGRRQHPHLPAQVEVHEVEPEQRRCPACGAEYHAHGSEDCEQLEIEVRAYRRVIKRRRYRRSCQCAAAAALLTAPAPSRLFIVQAVSEGHRVGAVVLLGICCGPDYDAERRYRRFRHQNPPCLRNITSFNHSAPRKAMSPLFCFHGRSGPGSAASQSASAFAFISRSISA